MKINNINFYFIFIGNKSSAGLFQKYLRSIDFNNEVKISFFQLYLNGIYDLIERNSIVGSLDEALKMIKLNLIRKKATSLNEASSRGFVFLELNAGGFT